ncbi:MAG: hypothetical protein QGI93_05145 [Planctomycetota bacterium]|jgi:methyl-accepting chemotaxis protein|nr:hypothetical protein [Candidatus Woesearchaeota archaeon]MDP6385563.1 hypothetical protein [Planctomycetota bacterium]MDP6739754.1 hypothetical protein [Planctomycetota bacterium]
MILKRKKKLINSRLQLKLIGVFLAVSCVASLFQVVLLNRSMMDLAQHLPSDGDRLLSRVPEILAMNVFLTIAVLGPLTFLIWLLVAHRVAGPAYNMTRFCEAIARGEQRRPCRIRDDDELQDLCKALNAAIERVREDSASQQSSESLGEAPSLVSEEVPEAEVQGSKES